MQINDHIDGKKTLHLQFYTIRVPCRGLVNARFIRSHRVTSSSSGVDRLHIMSNFFHTYNYSFLELVMSFNIDAMHYLEIPSAEQHIVLIYWNMSIQIYYSQATQDLENTPCDYICT